MVKFDQNKPKYYSIFNRKRMEERESRQRNGKMFATTTSSKNVKRDSLSRLSKVNPMPADGRDSIFSFRDIEG